MRRFLVLSSGAALVLVALLGQNTLAEQTLAPAPVTGAIADPPDLAELPQVAQAKRPPPRRGAAAQPAGKPARDLADAKNVSLDFENTPLTDVIKIIAEVTKKNFLYDDRVRGNVTLISPDPLTPDEAFRVFEAILQVKGFTTVPGPGGVLKIVPVRAAKESPIETVPGTRAVPNRDLYITRLIPMRYVRAEAISNTLRPLVSKNANMVTYAPTNTIILTDTAANVRRLLTIIAEIDVKTYQEQIKIIPIEFADASTVAGHLQEIFGQASAGGSRRTRARRRTPARAQRTTTAQPTAAARTGDQIVGEVGEPRFITDERTNSIIVIAPLQTISQVENVVALLDYQRRGSGRIHVYRLQNADAEEMAQTLSTLAQSAGQPAGGARAAGGASAQQATAVAELAGGVQVTSDAPTNSLIIQASSEGFAAIKDVIQALDVRRPQVMVEALIMEVDVDDDSALGGGFLFQDAVNGESDSRIAIESRNPRATDTSQLDLSSAYGGNPLDNFTTAILGRTVTILNEDGSVVRLPTIQGIITARASDEDTNIISAPVLLTADNEEAQIVVGENIPVITSRVQSAAGTTGGTDSLATSNNVERQDVGVTLRVTPQISEGDTVRLDIFQEISEVTSQDPDLGPTTSNRTVENTVYVQDGEAVMIGGIISERQIATVSKVPWLGDIPILGWAFKSHSESSAKKNLLVILTPHIVRDPGDLQRLTVEQRERFRNQARDQMALSEEEKKEREEALKAGVDLPADENPVRRELSEHSSVYPVDQLPLLRREHETRSAERAEEMRRRQSVEGGTYLVQVAFFRQTDSAIQLLSKLIGEGYDGTVLTRTERGEVLHFVQLGPYASQDRAHHVARNVKVSTGLEPMILIEP